jgi:hypothetical protein
LAGETEVLRKNCPNAASSTTNPTCCPVANPGSHGGKPATNCLSYDTTLSEKIELSTTTAVITTKPTYAVYSMVIDGVILQPIKK